MRLVTLYVPAADNDGNPRPKITDYAATCILELAGGATITSGRGLCMGEVVSYDEPVNLISTLIEDDASLLPFRELARRIKLELAQESVLLTIAPDVAAEFL